MLKWIIGLLIVVAAGVALWWTGSLNSVMAMFGMGQTAKQVAQVPAPQQPAPQQPVAQTPPNDLPTALSDASNPALAQDWSSIDLQVQALSTDSANIDQGLADKPIAQTN